MVRYAEICFDIVQYESRFRHGDYRLANVAKVNQEQANLAGTEIMKIYSVQMPSGCFLNIF